NLKENMTIKHIGPAKIVFEQRGRESVWNNTNQLTEGYLIKRYNFYAYNKWIKIEQEFVNVGNSSIYRQSSPAGALALDAERAFGVGYFNGEINNGVWAGYAGVITAFIQINQTGTSNYYPVNLPSEKRIGIQLNNTQINPLQKISQATVVYFNDTETDFVGASELSDKFYNPENISLSNVEGFGVTITPITDFDFYNLNEQILILGNNTIDPYNLTTYMNATINLGTPDPSDDITLILYNDGTNNDTQAGDSIFTNVFHIQPYHSDGLWNITIKAYSNESVMLKQATKTINVTKIYNASVQVSNPSVFNGYPVNAFIYVRNFRQDTFIPSANISCYIQDQLIPNQTVDYNNGIYSISFNAPMQAGYYNLFCNATRFNNTGSGYDIFMVEDLRTNMTIFVNPETYDSYNITWLVSENFFIKTNTTNIGNGTAYNNNITLDLPAGWTSNVTNANCGNVFFGATCYQDFEITIKNGTAPGSYVVNITTQWRNPDNTTNQNTTSLIVNVYPNVIIDVLESEIQNTAPSGREKQIGSFTIYSLGNEQLENVTFNVSNLDDFDFVFNPSGFNNISAGGVQIVTVNITVPNGYLPGNYSGFINISSSNDGFEIINLYINVVGTNFTIEIFPNNYTANYITSSKNESFVFSSNSTNIGLNLGYNVNITLDLPTNWYANATILECGNLDINQSCYSDFYITIPNRTRSGEYLINISSVWFEPDNGIITNVTSLIANVTSNVTIVILENYFNITTGHGNKTYLGNFTIRSYGNDPVENITYEFYPSNFTFEFNPNITFAESGDETLIDVNVTTSYGFYPGNYSGYLLVNTSNAGQKNISINIEVKPDMSWNITPTVCHKLEFPEEGVACQVTINNTGNLAIAFNITPNAANYTRVSTTNFTVPAADVFIFDVYYNVTGITKGYFNTTYTVDALNTSASPSFEFLRIFLSPLIYPLTTSYVFPQITHQGGNVSIYANITDQSGQGLNYVTAIVYSPKGNVYSANMSRIWNSSENSTWFISFPSSWGSTMQRGNYSILIRSFDMASNEGNSTNYIIIYPNMSITLDAGDQYQGRVGTYYIRVHDANGDYLPFSNISVTMINSNNNITFNRSQQANQFGEVNEDQRQFTIASDSPTGLYRIYTNASWYDNLSNMQINGSQQSNFTVYATLGGGLFVDVATTVVWYPNNVMKFSITVYNDMGLVIDPETMNLTVYDPADNVYFFVPIAAMTRQDTGFYTYNFAMPLNTSTGAYRAVVTASKGSLFTRDVIPFRVAAGGPYDVRLELIDTEVPLGDYLDFNFIVENKGETSQDVDVEFWVTDENENVWYYSSEAVYTPAFSNQTFPRRAFIFNNQNLGLHRLNVRVTYDLVQQPIRKNVSFIVVQALPPQPPGPAPGPAGPGEVPGKEMPPAIERVENKIAIESYPSEIGIESGWARYPTVKVKNVGNTILKDIRILIRGIPLEWISVDPLSIEKLNPQEVAIFSLRITVPPGEKTKEYPFKIIAISNETSDEKIGTLFVFSSREELLRYELEKVKNQYASLLNQTNQAEKDGKDVVAVRVLLDEAKRKIDEADELINKKDYDNVLEKII
ncbi:MAG: NEW3 domain-containing protein, partial [Candidatus Aenigmatarchaeota archaeon]